MYFYCRIDDYSLIPRSLSQKKKGFVLDGVRITSKLHDYNALKDRHLKGFFYSRGIRRHLLQVGMVNFI